MIESTDSPILDYQASTYYNRHIFILNQADLFTAYHHIHLNFNKLGTQITKHRDVDGHSHVSLLPFLLVMQRQGATAFSALSSHQSYQAWVLLRPCVEAALIIGKWIDDPKNAGIWSDRQKDQEAYQRTYQGKYLFSKSLPRSGPILGVLRRINDDFMHLNSRYYHRHTSLESVDAENLNMKLHYFDPDDADNRAHGLAFLHLVVAIQDSIAELLCNLFPKANKAQIGLSVFETEYADKVDDFVSKYPDRKDILADLGLWSFNEAA